MEIPAPLKKFLLRDSDDNLLFTLFGLVTLCIFFIHIIAPNNLSNNFHDDIGILVDNAQILATIFAITTSFTILGLQYVSQEFTPKIMQYVLKSKKFQLYFGLYAIGIISNLFVASFPKIIDPSKFLFCSYIILVFCILFLFDLVKSLVSSVQPIRLIKEIEMGIPDNFHETIISRLNGPILYDYILIDPFYDLEQIVIRSIRKNDHATFSLSFQRIIFFNRRYLKKMEKLSVDHGYIELWRKTGAIQKYFFRIYDQILVEIIAQNNERFLGEYSSLLYTITESHFKLKNDYSIEQFEKIFEEIGRLIIEKRFHRSGKIYFVNVLKVLEIEFAHLSTGDTYLGFSETFPNINDLSKKESDLLIYDRKVQSRFDEELTFFVKLASHISSDDEFNYVFGYLNSTIETLIINSFDHNFNERFKQYILYRLFSSHLSVQKMSLNNGRVNVDALGSFIMSISGNPEKYNIVPIKDLFVDYFKGIGRLALEFDDYYSLGSIAIASRVLIGEYPSVVSELVDILIDCSKVIRQNGDTTKINIQDVKRELDSIKRFNKNNIVEINTKIDTEIIQIDAVS